MSTYKHDSVEISIKDLFLTLMKKFLVMFIVGALIGGILGGVKIIQRVKTNDVLDAGKKLSDSETDVQYELRVQNINRARTFVDMVSNLNLQINHQRAYISDSIYMQIDAENVYQTTAQITLSLSNNDVHGLDSILFAAYEREVKAGNYLDEYSAQIGTKPDYVKDLISFSSSNPNSSLIVTDADYNTIGSMYISVYGPSRDFCDTVVNLIIEKVNSIYEDLNSTVATHTIAVVGIQQIVKVDNAIRDGQINQTGKIDTLQKQIVSYNESLDKVASDLGVSGKEALLEYFEVHEEVVVDGIPTNTSEINVSRWTMIKPGIKHGIIGFAIGVFLVAVAYTLKYIFCGKFDTQSQFFTRFSGIRTIGIMKPLEKRSRYAAFIDKKTEDDSGLSSENTNKLIKINYDNLTRNYKKVLITGTGSEKDARKALSSLGVSGDYKPNMFSDPDVLRSVSEYDGVVLIEQRNSSAYRDVEHEIDLISNSGVSIIGAIIL